MLETGLCGRFPPPSKCIVVAKEKGSQSSRTLYSKGNSKETGWKRKMRLRYMAHGYLIVQPLV